MPKLKFEQTIEIGELPPKGFEAKTYTEAAALMGVSESLIRRLVANNRLKAYRLPYDIQYRDMVDMRDVRKKVKQRESVQLNLPMEMD